MSGLGARALAFVAMVAAAGLLTAATANGDPPEGPIKCYAPEVTSFKGPAAVKSDGTGTFVAVLTNPNTAGSCDDGLIAEISFNNTKDAISSVDGVPDIVCSRGDPTAFAFTERCVASAFAGGTTATITFDTQKIAKPDHIVVSAKTLGDPIGTNPSRPGKIDWMDLS